MNLRTEILIDPSVNQITHQTPVMLIGSCFTDNIGSRLNEHSFPVNMNPCGTVYNPHSVIRTLEILADGKELTESDLDYFNDLWFSFDHHTSFSHPDKFECLEKINHTIRTGAEFLKTTRYILLTFGTARIYRHKKLNRIVSNCHKIPSAEFERDIMNVDQIIEITQKMMGNISSINPAVKFIFTISPVRHWKDGATGNQISKAALILAVHRLVESNPELAEYFPAYELLLDDLRDYRFYAGDLLHPGPLGIEYIWTKFSQAYFRDQTNLINKEIATLNNAMKHRPFHKTTDAWRKFTLQHKKKVEALIQQFPYLKLGKYLEYFSQI